MRISKDARNGLIGVLICISTVVLLITLDAPKRRMLKALTPHLGEWTSADGLVEYNGESPYIKGKAVLIEKPLSGPPKMGKDSIYSIALPSEIRATSADQVDTIIWLTYSSLKTGEYVDGTPAFTRRCEVTVIDRSRRAIVGKQIIDSTPPDVINANASKGEGIDPDGPAAWYIRRLPRR
jgi:hypothetical protein